MHWCGIVIKIWGGSLGTYSSTRSDVHHTAQAHVATQVRLIYASESQTDLFPITMLNRICSHMRGQPQQRMGGQHPHNNKPNTRGKEGSAGGCSMKMIIKLTLR